MAKLVIKQRPTKKAQRKRIVFRSKSDPQPGWRSDTCKSTSRSSVRTPSMIVR